MRRGTVAGFLVGTAVMAVGAAVLSLSVPMDAQVPSLAAPEAQRSEDPAPEQAAAPTPNDADMAQQTVEAAPEAEAPADPDTAAPAAPFELPEVAPVIVPQTGGVPGTEAATPDSDAPASAAGEMITAMEDAAEPVEPAPTDPAAETGDAPTAEPELTLDFDKDDNDSPLERFASDATEIAPDLPRLAIVLLDDGSSAQGPAAFEGFQFPLTFAIDPDHPDPAGAAAAYRALGFEVMAVARAPEGASPADAEVLVRGALSTVPEAIGVIEGPEGGLQASRDVATQVARVLSETGHALVSQPQGTNTGQQLAAQAGVPSAPVFRDFDSEGQDARVIRRFLDQGAFRAGQRGTVVMMGRVRSDTIRALVLWGLQDRAQSVALVPVSVILREEQPPTP